MKFGKESLVLLVLSSCFVGCSGGSSSVTPPQIAPPVAPVEAPSLSGLSTRDLLRTKYTLAELQCQANFPLTTEEHGQSQTTTALGAVNWDLLNDYADKQSLVMNVENSGVTLTVNIKVDKVEILDNIMVQDAQNSYQLQNTPVITGSFDYTTDKPISFEGIETIPSGRGPFSFYEGVQTSLANSAATGKQVGARDSYETELHISCTLNTQLNVAYQNQFSKTSQQN